MSWDLLGDCEELVWCAELGDIVSVFFVGQCEKPQNARVTRVPGPHLSASSQGTVQSAEGWKAKRRAARVEPEGLELSPSACSWSHPPPSSNKEW